MCSEDTKMINGIMCIQCKSEVDIKDIFCKTCGHKLEKGDKFKCERCGIIYQKGFAAACHCKSKLCHECYSILYVS